MGPEAQRAYLSGIMDAVKQRVGRVREGNSAAVVVMNPNERQAITAAMTAAGMPVDAANRLIGNVARESQMQATSNGVLRNSRTAQRSEYNETERTAGTIGAGMAADLATGMPGVATAAAAGGRMLQARGTPTWVPASWSARASCCASSGDLILPASRPRWELEARRAVVEAQRRANWSTPALAFVPGRVGAMVAGPGPVNVMPPAGLGALFGDEEERRRRGLR